MTSDAHTWQIENAEPDGDPYLAASADPLDIRHLVFENGWIYIHREGFVQDEDTVEAIQSLQDTQAETAERIESKNAEVFTADDRLQYATGRRGREMESFWHFGPAEFAGVPLDVVAFRAGWDAHRESVAADDQ